MAAFNRQESKDKAILKKQYRAIIQAKQGHPDMKLKHPDWLRDAAKGDFTMLKKKIKEDCEKKQFKHQKFQEKLHAKQN